MGLLRKLLGRREDEPADADASDPAPSRGEDASSSGASDARPRSSVLEDAAPLPEAAEAAREPAAVAVATDPPSPPAPRREVAAPGESDAENDVESRGEPETTATADDPTGRDSAAADAEPSGGDAAPGEEGAESATAAESESDVSDPEKHADRDVAAEAGGEPTGFVPQRPSRELLDLEPPKQPPAPEPADPTATALPLDVSGSPRAALRNAGLTVPHMQQIVQLPDARLWAFGVRAEEALGWWLQIRQAHEQTGWMPVLLGAADDWLDNGEGVLHEGDDELGRMKELEPEQLLRQKAAEAGEPARGVPILSARGDSDFAVPKTDGLLGLVQAEHGWEIPALLPWKGSSDWELYGAEHAAVLKHWHRQHEVELVSMTWDILELYVPSPPTGDEEVLRVAGEAYAYCPDLLAAGVPTLDDLAVHMIRSRAWYFRWA